MTHAHASAPSGISVPATLVREPELRSLLDDIVADPGVHVRWLNTLSFLEFMGTRKIARSMSRRPANRIALQHLAEEARHAYFFKRSIERIAPGVDPGYAWSELLAGLPAARYFNRLDLLVKRDLHEPPASLAPVARRNVAELCYLYVTTLIEERAGTIYPLYDACLAQRDVPLRLAGVIMEEEQHLSDMYGALRELDPGCESRLDRYRQAEGAYFARFFDCLRLSVSGAAYSTTR
jgi:hypothetical protein